MTISARNRKNVSPPMHQVKLRRMPLLRTATGCRWRKTLRHDRHDARAPIARHAVAEDGVPDLRVADVFERPSIRPIEWLLQIDFCDLSSTRSDNDSHNQSPILSVLQERHEALRILPLAQFLAEDLRLIDHHIPVGVHGDRETFERPRRRDLRS